MVVAFLLCGCDPLLRRNKQTKKEKRLQFDMSECGTWCGCFRRWYLPPLMLVSCRSEVSALNVEFSEQNETGQSVSLHLEALLCVCPICLTRKSVTGRCVLCFASREQSCSASCRDFQPRRRRAPHVKISRDGRIDQAEVDAIGRPRSPSGSISAGARC